MQVQYAYSSNARIQEQIYNMGKQRKYYKCQCNVVPVDSTNACDPRVPYNHNDNEEEIHDVGLLVLQGLYPRLDMREDDESDTTCYKSILSRYPSEYVDCYN